MSNLGPEAETEPSAIDFISNDSLLLIFKKLPPQQVVKAASRTCWRFFEMSRSEYYWASEFKKLSNYIPAITETYQECYKKLMTMRKECKNQSGLDFVNSMIKSTIQNDQHAAFILQTPEFLRAIIEDKHFGYQSVIQLGYAGPMAVKALSQNDSLITHMSQSSNSNFFKLCSLGKQYPCLRNAILQNSHIKESYSNHQEYQKVLRVEACTTKNEVSEVTQNLRQLRLVR